MSNNHTSDIAISGTVAPGFEPVQDQLAQLVHTGDEKGCQLAVTRDGQTVVNLVAGHTDRGGTTPVTPQTLIPVYSVSKAISAMVVGLLVQDGLIDYTAPVAAYWPEFAANGKANITVEHAMSHQAGLPGIPEDWAADDWYDWPKATHRLAGLTPLWSLGSASGYHPISWGHIIGEIVRRASGLTIGQNLRQRLGDRFGLDVWVGLPQDHHHRAATPRKANTPPHLGDINRETQLAFLKPWSSPRYGKGDTASWLSQEIPAANGHATALGLAQLFQPLARAGLLDDQPVLAAQTIDAMVRERIAGPDRVLPFDISWAAGLIRNTAAPERLYYGLGPRTVGHTGFGGSCIFADPDARLTFAYTTLTHSPALVTDARAQALTQAVYRAA